MASSWWRTAAFLSVASLSNVALLWPASAWAQDAKALLADGDKAVKSKDWTAAAKAFDAANKASPSPEALEGLANAYYQGGQHGEAFTAYTEWNAKYGDKYPGKKAALATRLKDLEGKTGAITLTINEAGATILIDDKPVGTAPLAAPLRLTAGPHRIRVTKDGFIPFDQAPNVSAGASTTVDVKLTAASGKAKLVVKEKTGKGGVRVIVDGVDMGEAPWTGDVEPGPHDVTLRGQGLAAMPQKITAERGKTQEIELVASSATTPVKLNTGDGKGLIYLDGKLVGEGSFVGEIPAGVHKLRITRDGYDPFEEDITFKDKDPYARVITLKLSSKIETGQVVEIERLEGLYGGFSLLGMFIPGGTGNSIEKQCEARSTVPDLTSCDEGSGMGGGFGAFLGYHWDPVGIELFAAGQYDQQSMTNDWRNPPQALPGIGPDPARHEDFSVRRAGGIFLARIRLDHQWSKVRLSLAAGAGFSYRVMFLERDSTSPDGKAKDKFASDAVSYVSPAVGLEPSVMYRLTKGVAVALGMQMFFDAPSTAVFGGTNPKTTQEANHGLYDVQTKALTGTLSTPPFELASNMQIYIGPYLGMMFGP